MELKYHKPLLSNFNVKSIDIKRMFKESNLKSTDVLKMLAIPDSHVPDHDVRAFGAVGAFASDYKPHALLFLGDFIENEPSSHWPSLSARVRRLVPELVIARSVKQILIESCGKQLRHKFFLIGNHEDWTDQLFVSKIPEVYDGISTLNLDLSIDNLLGLKEDNFTVIPINDILRIGYAHFIHGYYTGDSHAKKHATVFGVNIYYGHLHDCQSYTHVSVQGVREAASLGCLRTLNANFLKGKPNNWLHAISCFEFRIDGTYTRNTMVIIDGAFSFNGKLYRGDKNNAFATTHA